MSSSDTSIISLLSYSFFILLGLIGVLVIYKLLLRKNIEIERVDKITDLFKWFILSLSISTITLLVTDLFKEREQDLEEMKAFKEYLPTVLDTTKSIDSKIDLLEFMAIVTPNGSLQDAWKSYLALLKQKKSMLVSIDESIVKMQDSLTLEEKIPNEKQIKYLQSLEEKRNDILNDVNAKKTSRFLVIISADKSLEETLTEVKFAKDINTEAIVYKKGNWFNTAIPVTTTFEEAKRLSEKIMSISKGKRKSYVVSEESWCTNSILSADSKFFICQ